MHSAYSACTVGHSTGTSCVYSATCGTWLLFLCTFFNKRSHGALTQLATLQDKVSINENQSIFSSAGRCIIQIFNIFTIYEIKKGDSSSLTIVTVVV